MSLCNFNPESDIEIALKCDCKGCQTIVDDVIDIMVDEELEVVSDDSSNHYILNIDEELEVCRAVSHPFPSHNKGKQDHRDHEANKFTEQDNLDYEARRNYIDKKLEVNKDD